MDEQNYYKRLYYYQTPTIISLTQFIKALNAWLFYVGFQLLTVQCLKGTYQNEHSCIFCPLDTYQPLDGQTTCLNCPANFTTKAIGATNCTVGMM